jgi:hypothetical protein
MKATITHQDIELLIDYYYEPGEDSSYDYPGSAPTVEIYAIYVGDVDIYDLICHKEIEALESKLIEMNEKW